MCTCQNTLGHGLSYRLTDDPSLIYVDSWERYVRDFLKICHGIKKTYPDLHLNLFAHSMGGGIGASAAAWEPELFHKIILSSPMIRPLTGNVPWSLAVMAAWGCVSWEEAKLMWQVRSPMITAKLLKQVPDLPKPDLKDIMLFGKIKKSCRHVLLLMAGCLQLQK